MVGFSGIWRSVPSLTLIVAGGDIGEEALEVEVRECLSLSNTSDDDDPFPRWQPGDPAPPILCETSPVYRRAGS